MDNREKNKLILTVIMAVIFGLAGGIVGELVARAYLFETAFNIPLFGEINFTGTAAGGSNVVIRDARKVVVEQDAKVVETAAAVSASLVGIFGKINPATTTQSAQSLTPTAASESYRLADELAEGFIITSDGWIITSYLPKELASQPKTATATPGMASRYVVITKGKKVYPVDAIMADPRLKYAFWHVRASDLPVRKFALPEEIVNGQTVLALNWDGQIFPSTIFSQIDETDLPVKFSDDLNFKIQLAGFQGENILSGFLFNLNGDLVGLYNSSGRIDSIANLRPVINNLLKNKSTERPSLGVYYQDLDDLVFIDNGWPDKGALIMKNKDGMAIAKGSAAEKAGLQAGDIITAVNLAEIDEDSSLNIKIADFLPGEKIIITFLRNGAEKDVEVMLGQR